MSVMRFLGFYNAFSNPLPASPLSGGGALTPFLALARGGALAHFPPLARGRDLTQSPPMVRGGALTQFPPLARGGLGWGCLKAQHPLQLPDKKQIKAKQHELLAQKWVGG